MLFLLFSVFQILFINYYNVNSVVIDMSTGTNLATGKYWLEIGFTSLIDSSWTSVSTIGSGFVDPIILIGLPENGGSLYTQGKALSSRLRNVVKSGSVSFQVKLFQPNDSFCSKQWYVPSYITTPISTSWCVVEKGAFNVSSNSQWSQFTIYSGPVNRTTTTVQIWNFVVPSTCKVGGVSGQSCAYPNSINPNTQLGAIATIQTLVYNTYMLLRTSRIRRRDVTLVLTPHDSTTASYFSFPISETAGFMMFITGKTLACIEKLAFETRRFPSITSDKFSYTYTWKYARVPGIFGHLLTQNSATDSTGLRTFGRNLTLSYIITQEDYCDSSDPIHTTQEVAAVFVVGELSASGTVVCGVIYTGPTDAPTSAPTRTPTSSPSVLPTFAPTRSPTTSPTFAPTFTPTFAPTSAPTSTPSTNPTFVPTRSPTFAPTSSPTSAPTSAPTFNPTFGPTFRPTAFPTSSPTSSPTFRPTSFPTFTPSSSPTFTPSTSPTFKPTASPSVAPTVGVTAAPTTICSNSFPVEMTKV